MGRATQVQARVRERFPEVAVEASPGADMDVLTVGAASIVDVLTIVRDEFAFEVLSDLSAVDWLPREPRYDVNYHLYSLANNDRLRVKVKIGDGETPHVPSVVGVWTGADWHEREVYDFFGIVFDGHPDLKRILMPDEWIGHPLRKDYPVGGVPVEYRIEPAYVGDNIVPGQAAPAAGGVPARLRRDRGLPSPWTWTGPPASGVPQREPAEDHEQSEEGKES
jgi:NADH-quinone oxidoreductase subunit C